MLGSHPDLSCCEDVSARLSELLDGELDPPSTASVLVHLVSCEGCARAALELAATVGALRALRSAERGKDPAAH
jgi:anti-sigma factor RsiW